MKHDVIWWWQGGTRLGSWREAVVVDSVAQTIRDINLMGYCAIAGLRSIGKPEGPPSAELWDRLMEVCGTDMR